MTVASYQQRWLYVYSGIKRQVSIFSKTFFFTFLVSVGIREITPTDLTISQFHNIKYSLFKKKKKGNRIKESKIINI